MWLKRIVEIVYMYVSVWACICSIAGETVKGEKFHGLPMEVGKGKRKEFTAYGKAHMCC